MLYRTSLGSPHQSLRREIDRLFEDAVGRGDSTRSWLPSVDVRETEKAIVLEFELPGIRAENVDLSSENGVLTVRGEKREERKEGDEQEGRYHVIERSFGSFTRSFQLPPGIDEEEIDAEFENGVLTVHVPKSESPRSRRIEIGARRQGEVTQGSASKMGGREQIRGASGGERGTESRSTSGAGSRSDSRSNAGSRGSPSSAREETRGEPRGEREQQPRAASGKGSSAKGERGESKGSGGSSRNR